MPYNTSHFVFVISKGQLSIQKKSYKRSKSHHHLPPADLVEQSVMEVGSGHILNEHLMVSHVDMLVPPHLLVLSTKLLHPENHLRVVSWSKVLYMPLEDGGG